MTSTKIYDTGDNLGPKGNGTFETLHQITDDSSRANMHKTQMDNLNMELSIHAVSRGPVNFTLNRAQSKPNV